MSFDLRMAFGATALLVVTIARSAHGGGQTIHVPGDFVTIQEAIDAAAGGDEIIVAPGTYNEAIDFLGKAIHLRSSDGPDVTTIDATNIAPPEETVSVVSFVSEETRDAILEGFTITGGSGTNAPAVAGILGGGVFIQESSPTVIGCVLTGNTGGIGGGIGISLSDAPPLIQDCTFLQNHAFATPAAFGGGAAVSNCTAHFVNCTFEQNTADVGGGMVIIGSVLGGSTILDDCMFRENESTMHGGAVDLNNGAVAEFVACDFIQNVAGSEGGGVHLLGGNFPSVVPAIATFDDCEFVGNLAQSSGGGAIRHYGISLTLLNSSFTHNEAGSAGGALSNLGASTSSELHVENCTFGNNSAPDAGAIFSWFSSTVSLNLAESTFCNNDPNHVDGPWSDLGGNEFLESCPSPNTADLDNNGVVNVFDLLILLAAWGECPPVELDECPADLDGNGVVNVFDLLELLANWG